MSFCYIAVDSDGLGLTLEPVKFKIGSTVDVKSRMNQLRTSCPNIWLFHAWFFEGHRGGDEMEKKLQTYYKTAKLKLEWFSVPGVELEAIRQFSSTDILGLTDNYNWQQKYEYLKGWRDQSNMYDSVLVAIGILKAEGAA